MKIICAVNLCKTNMDSTKIERWEDIENSKRMKTLQIWVNLVKWSKNANDRQNLCSKSFLDNRQSQTNIEGREKKLLCSWTFSFNLIFLEFVSWSYTDTDSTGRHTREHRKNSKIGVDGIRVPLNFWMNLTNWVFWWSKLDEVELV